jgi:hypothetical protein
LINVSFPSRPVGDQFTARAGERTLELLQLLIDDGSQFVHTGRHYSRRQATDNTLSSQAAAAGLAGDSFVKRFLDGS